MKDSDKQVVANLRRLYGKAVEKYTDEKLAETWWIFSGSDEYPDDDDLSRFPLWLEAE
jgi:hypothetical protein